MIATVLWGIALVFVVDAIRRPSSQWTGADRNRTFWVMMLLLLGPLTLLIYLVGVFPRLLAAAREGAGPAEFIR